MPKVTNQEIIDLGFTPEMLRQADENVFKEYIDSVITGQSLILGGRIGSSAYASASSPTQYYVKRAELCLVAAELISRRINFILSNVTGNGQEIDTTHESEQRKTYQDEADALINKITAGITTDTGSDIVTGALETSHFEDSDA